jgi:hypothetical protein
MKISVLFFLLSTAVFINANAAGLIIKETSSAGDTVIISFAETTHDYGTIKKDSDGTFVFTFKNTGNIPLVLSTVQASCGCTTPTWTQEPVAPGKSGEISVKYNTANIGGFVKTITVNSNAPVVVLTIKGAVQE